MSKTLDLGCGLNPQNPFNANEVYGVDLRDFGNEIKIANLAINPIPFEAESFDYVSAFDLIGYIPKIAYIPQPRNCFVELMNEIWRVLKMGGLFLSLTPAYPCSAAFRDPAQVNIISDETFLLYFDDHHRLASTSGFKGAFQIVSQEWRLPYLHTILRKTDLNREWRYTGADTSLLTEVGERKRTGIKTTGKDGCLLFGPYVALPASQYKAKIHLEGIHKEQALLRVDIVGNHGQSVFSKAEFVPESGNFTLELDWSLHLATKDIEIRIYVNEHTEVSILELEIQRQPEI